MFRFRRRLSQAGQTTARPLLIAGAAALTLAFIGISGQTNPGGQNASGTTTTTAAATTTTTAGGTTTTVAGTTTTAAATTTTTVAGSGTFTRTQDTNCINIPSLCGFADSNNTGIQSTAVLTQVPSQATSGTNWSLSSGTVTVTGNVGSTTTGLELADGIGVVINGSNLTASNIKVDGVHCTGTTCGATAFVVNSGDTNVTIDHCDAAGAPPGAATADIRGGSAAVHNFGTSTTVQYCNAHGFYGTFFENSYNGHTAYIGNYVHQVTCWNIINNNNNCGQGAGLGGEHCNAWATLGGPSAGDVNSSMLLQNNTFRMDDHGACASDTIATFQDAGNTNSASHYNFVMNHNLLTSSGGGCNAIGCVYIGNDSNGVFQYMAWTNNVFSDADGPSNGPIRQTLGNVPASGTYSCPFPVVRDGVSPCYLTWPMPISPGSGWHNFTCGNWNDMASSANAVSSGGGPARGGGADGSATPTSCASPPWTMPTGWYNYAFGARP